MNPKAIAAHRTELCAVCYQLFAKVLLNSTGSTPDYGDHRATLDTDNVFDNFQTCILCFKALTEISSMRGITAIGPQCRQTPIWLLEQQPEIARRLNTATNATVKISLFYRREFGGIRVMIQSEPLLRVGDPRLSRMHMMHFGVDNFGVDNRRWLRLDAAATWFANRMPSSILPDIDLHKWQVQVISRWIDTCVKGHPKCEAKGSQSRQLGRRARRASTSIGWRGPKRLIDVGTATRPARLIQTMPNTHMRYAALSHCWGTTPPPSMSKARLRDCSLEISSVLLSRTFSEALILCRLLGISYCWIDSLCIVQDDDDERDVEIRRMDNIYANCMLNIAATASANGSQGLFRPFHRITLGSAQVGKSMRVWQDSWYQKDVLESSALLQRGWGVQELVLSRRTIHFTDTAIIYHCKIGASSQCEADWSSLIQDVPKFDPADERNRDALDGLWLKLAERYSRTYTTQQQDRHYSILALALRFQQRHQQLTRYTKSIPPALHGCWRHNIFLWLTWEEHKQKTSSTPVSIPIDPTIPTWSWMSCRSVSFPTRFHSLYGMKSLNMRHTMAFVAEARAEASLLLKTAWCRAHKPACQQTTSSQTFWELDIIYEDVTTPGDPSGWQKPSVVFDSWLFREELPKEYVLLVGAQLDGKASGSQIEGIVCIAKGQNPDGHRKLRRCGYFWYNIFASPNREALPYFMQKDGLFWLV